MTTRTLVIVVIVLTLCVALAATNPTKRDYETFLEASVSRALERSHPSASRHEEQVLRDVLKSQGKKVIESIVRSKTIRSNYGLFSVFETQAFDVRLVVVGVGVN